MSLSKRGRYWHYDFQYRGKRYQGSTNQTNINKAKLTEAKVRSDAALEAFGLAAPKIAPPFKEFMEGRFLAHVRQHNKEKPRTVAFYEEKTRRLLEYPPFQGVRVSEVDEDAASQYQQYRSQQPKTRNGTGTISNASINREVATLRKALTLAFEWKLIARRPKLHTLPGERGREFVLTGEMENAYLARCVYPLKQAAILMLDLGLRPEECVSLRKDDVSDAAVFVRAGKSKNAVRSVPQSARTREVFKLLRELWPNSEFFFPGHKKGSHLQRSSLDHMHTRVRGIVSGAATEQNRAVILPVQTEQMPAVDAKRFPPEFVLYSLRHTFGTRLAESGASPYDIKEAMGHSDIRVSQKYVHVSGDHLALAMKRKEMLDRVLRGEIHEETPDTLRRG